MRNLHLDPASTYSSIGLNKGVEIAAKVGLDSLSGCREIFKCVYHIQ